MVVPVLFIALERLAATLTGQLLLACCRSALARCRAAKPPIAVATAVEGQYAQPRAWRASGMAPTTPPDDPGSAYRLPGSAPASGASVGDALVSNGERFLPPFGTYAPPTAPSLFLQKRTTRPLFAAARSPCPPAPSTHARLTRPALRVIFISLRRFRLAARPPAGAGAEWADSRRLHKN
eukprot:COSAG02_NODE_5187_length_4558_cov_2.566495_2_plen_180_part_00